MLVAVAGGTSTSSNYTVGSHSLTPSTTSLLGYSLSYTNGSLTVNQKNITVSGITVSDKIYDGLTSASTGGTVVFGGIVSGDVLTLASISGVFSDGNVGSGKTVTLSSTYGGSDIANYSFTDQASTTAYITRAVLTVTAVDDSKTYDGLAYTGGNGVNYSGFVNSETNAVLGGTLAYGGTSQTATNAGSYVITPSGYTSGNYTLSYNNGALTINTENLTVTASDQSKIYGANLSLGTSAFTSSGLVNSETIGSVTLTSTGLNDINTSANASTYSNDLVANAATGGSFIASNYNINYATGDLTINKAALTVTATDDSKTYDGLAYSDGNGVTYSGLVNSETNSVLGGTLAYGGDCTRGNQCGDLYAYAEWLHLE